jgi:aminoglycoside phosphotransferase (APT) family kinase protein
VQVFLKERARPEPGSIPALLQMFERELHFYREIAPVVGVRVPACYSAEESTEGFRLVLEDLSSWCERPDPRKAAAALAELHRRWQGSSEQRWPWLRRDGRAAGAVGDLYDRVWRSMDRRADLTPAVRRFGSSLVGRVAALEEDTASSTERTLIHGDATLRNTMMSADGVIAWVDWEDVRSGCGLVDLAWLLVSSVPPEQWEEVIAAYGASRDELAVAMPAAAAQGILSLPDFEQGSPAAAGWMRRLEAAVEQFTPTPTETR